MKYEAFFLCNDCGHQWKTYYARLKKLERGDVCENCLYRPSPPSLQEYRERGCVAEPYFYRKLEEEK